MTNEGPQGDTPATPCLLPSSSCTPFLRMKSLTSPESAVRIQASPEQSPPHSPARSPNAPGPMWPRPDYVSGAGGQSPTRAQTQEGPAPLHCLLTGLPRSWPEGRGGSRDPPADGPSAPRSRGPDLPNPQGPRLVLCPPLRKGPDGSGDQRGSPRNTYKDWGTQAPAVLGWVRGESEGTSSAVLNN